MKTNIKNSAHEVNGVAQVARKLNDNGGSNPPSRKPDFCANNDPSPPLRGDDHERESVHGCSLTEWLTTEEAAHYLKVSVPSLRNMTSNGKIPYYKFARRNRYRIDELRRLLLTNPKGDFYGNNLR